LAWLPLVMLLGTVQCARWSEREESIESRGSVEREREQIERRDRERAERVSERRERERRESE
jgi:hypothetical protein